MKDMTVTRIKAETMIITTKDTGGLDRENELEETEVEVETVIGIRSILKDPGRGLDPDQDQESKEIAAIEGVEIEAEAVKEADMNAPVAINEKQGNLLMSQIRIVAETQIILRGRQSLVKWYRS